MANGNGSFQVSSGSQKDMVIAYILRGLLIVGQAVLGLILFAILKAAMVMRDDMHDVKKDMPSIQQEIKDIKSGMSDMKERSSKYVTKEQLDEAEKRVRIDFTEQLKQHQPIVTRR